MYVHIDVENHCFLHQHLYKYLIFDVAELNKKGQG